MRHCARDLDGFGFWSDNGQPFNNPTPALASNFLAGLHWKRHGVASCSSKMISFSNINKQYGKQLLFVDASFQLNPGEKVGLVGPNGAGKTTLFRMVVGEETPDDTYCAWLDETGAPVGVQQKLMRHAHVSTTMDQYGNASALAKRKANRPIVQRLLQRPANQEVSIQ